MKTILSTSLILSLLSTAICVPQPHYSSKRLVGVHKLTARYHKQHNLLGADLQGNATVVASGLRSGSALNQKGHRHHGIGQAKGLSPSRIRRGHGGGTRTRREDVNRNPTPAPTGASSSLTTVFIDSDSVFALLLPRNPNEPISDAEVDAIAFCTDPSSECANTVLPGFIRAAAVARGPSWIQVTGCMDPTLFPFSPNDEGGQFDVRFPDGAQCAFGGYGASFTEQVEPSAGRFCLRCCADPDDQVNCNSHQDRAGCLKAIPGTYDFPDKGVSCS